MEEIVEVEKTRAWVFAIAGVIAAVVGPILAQIAEAPTVIFVALTFGAAAGVIDTVGVRDNLEVVGRTLAGIGLGALLALFLFAYQSILIGGLTLGLGVVISRWIWVEVEERKLGAGAMAMAIAGAGVWMMAPMVDAGAAWQGFNLLHPVAWGIFAGMATIVMEKSESSAVEIGGTDGRLGRPAAMIGGGDEDGRP